MRLSAFALIVLSLSGAACPRTNDMKANTASQTALRAEGDPNLAVQSELDAARRAGTIAAYDLFIARQRQHPLARVARRERAALARGAGK